jgi:hypothetical protein
MSTLDYNQTARLRAIEVVIEAILRRESQAVGPALLDDAESRLILRDNQHGDHDAQKIIDHWRTMLRNPEVMG